MSAVVRLKTALTLVASTLSHASSGYSSSGAPHVAPALLTRMCSFDSRSAIAAASRSLPALVERSAGMEIHGPIAPSCSAAASQTSALRDEMYTVAPDET